MSTVTKQQAQEYDLENLYIWGPKTIKVGETVYDINEMIERRRTQLRDGEIISEAKLQVRIADDDVELEHIREYLSRFFDYTVQHIDLQSGSWTWIIENKEQEIDAPWGKIKADITVRYDDLYYKLKQEISQNKHTLKEVFELLTSIKLQTTTAFDHVLSMMFVKRNAKQNPETGRYSHAIIFGCQGDCSPMLSVTSSQKDFDDFVEFFMVKGYSIRVHLCTVELKPKTIDRYVKERAEGYQRTEQCCVL